MRVELKVVSAEEVSMEQNVNNKLEGNKLNAEKSKIIQTPSGLPGS